MFDELTNRLETVIRKLGGQVVLNESSIRESLREIRRVLLEADVHYRLVQDFARSVEEKAVGRAVVKSVSPGQMMVKIVFDELVALLGGSSKPLLFADRPPTVIMLCGLQGSGKTTTAGKMALRLIGQNYKPAMIAADIYRPAAKEQLQSIGHDLGVPVYSGQDGLDVRSIVSRGLEWAAAQGADTVLIDTAGRLHIDRKMMDELVEVKKNASPHEVLLVVDGMTGQDAVRIAGSFHEKLRLTGLVLTKLDGDARGGAALSIFGVTGVPIKLVGVGERLEDLEIFHPDRMVSRLLQMGDIVSLVERAEEKMDLEAARKIEKKITSRGDLDLEDFLSTLRQMQKLGSVESLLRLIPGVNSKILSSVNLDPGRFKRLEAVILSMTPGERARPKMINASRRCRIAAGSGVPVQEVNRLLKQFDQMRQMMKNMGLLTKARGSAGRGGIPLPF